MQSGLGGFGERRQSEVWVTDIYGSAVQVGHTGNTDPTIVRTVTLDADTLSEDGQSLLIIPFTACNNNGNVKTFTVQIGGVTVSAVNLASMAGGRKYLEIFRRSSTQGVGSATNFAAGIGSVGAAITPAINWEIDNNIDFIVTLASSGDNIMLETLRIEKHQAP